METKLKIVASCGGSGCEAPHEKILPRLIKKAVITSIQNPLKKAA